jgi:menaquinone-dependent protoporphyrinogen oxidase
MVIKVLIVYGTRYGATASTSEEIAKVIRDEGFDVRVVNAKEEKVDNISEFDLVVVGSGMKMGKWTAEPEMFLKKFQKELAKKKVAIFVSSGAQAIIEYEGKPEEVGKAQREYLEEKAAKYSLRPIALGLFGGVWDYNKMGFFFRKTMSAYKQNIEAAGFKEIRPGLYDTRDWDAIRSWAKEIAQKARS